MKLYFPQIFSGSSAIHSCFTYANRDLLKQDKTISGLNFGLNTAATEKEIQDNLDQLFRFLNWGGTGIALARQVHGNQIQEADAPGIYANRDGLITRKEGMTLGIQVADCAAVLVADENSGIIGAFHAGWRGALSEIVPSGLKAMEAAGGILSDFKVYMSPSISVTHFEVGEEVSSLFPRRYRHESAGKKPKVNLKRYLTDQLLDSGIPEATIEVDPHCTFAEPFLYSYRREGEKSGRMLALIQLKTKMGR